MRKTEAEESWAVYEVVLGKQAGIRVMCRQSQWEALASTQPGANILIQDGIASESEAEKLARGKSGDAKPKTGTSAADGRRHIIKRESDS